MYGWFGHCERHGVWRVAEDDWDLDLYAEGSAAQCEH
jgi:hypothetical protein